jgi:hypothetical protein
VIRVKNIPGDDIFGLWRVKEIVVTKDGHRFAFAPDPETFTSKDEAEQHARLRARRFLQSRLGLTNGDIRGDSVPTLEE